MLCDGYALVKAEAKSTAATDEAADAGWFPRDADEAALRRRYKELARKYHPDVLGPEAGESELLKFQELTQEYTRLLASCKTDLERETLRKAWISLGGLTAAASLVISDPALAAIFIGSVGTLSLLPNVTSALTGVVFPTGSLSGAAGSAIGSDTSSALSKALRSFTPLANETVVTTKRLLTSLGSAAQGVQGGSDARPMSGALPMRDDTPSIGDDDRLTKRVAACVEALRVAEAEAESRASLALAAREAAQAAELRTASASEAADALRPQVAAARDALDAAERAYVAVTQTKNAKSARRRARQEALRSKRRADADAARIVLDQAQAALEDGEALRREASDQSVRLRAEYEGARARCDEARHAVGVLKEEAAAARARESAALAAQQRRRNAEAEARRVARAASVAGTALAGAAAAAANVGSQALAAAAEQAAEKAAGQLEAQVKQRALRRKRRRESERAGRS